MNFSFPRKKELRHKSRTVLGTVVKGAEELEGESCSVYDFGSCTQPCWIPRCQKHRIEPELNFRRAERFGTVQTPSTGSDDEVMTGEEAVDVEAWLLAKVNQLDAASKQRGEPRPGRTPAAEGVPKATGMMRRAAGIVWKVCAGETLQAKTSTKPNRDSPLANPEQAATQAATQAAEATPRISTRNALHPGRSRADTNYWTAGNTAIGAWTPSQLSCAPLLGDYNAAGHDLLLSHQRTRYTDGPVVRPQRLTREKTPTSAPYCRDRHKPGGAGRLATRISSNVGSWVHLRKFALRNCISHKRIWLQERFDRSRSTRAYEKQQRRAWARTEGPIGMEKEVSDSELGEIWRRSLEMAEDAERVCTGEIFGFDQACRSRERCDIDTGRRASRS